ncbi:MAG TPA: hypothetical protein VHV82_04610 [Sporichthyaceae bacterium]|jgi:hypothetical protein|nr:hypothetical protein [Sporichthyaceae bacterium]
MAVTKGLDLYLKDHLAGATGGSELAAKLCADHPDGPLGAFLAELSRDIDQDKETLQVLMHSLGVEPGAIKQAGAWLGEKVSRLKLTDAFTGSPELKRLLQFEMLALGIEGKGELWRSLTAVAKSALVIDADLEALTRRAENQRAGLEAHRLEAARAALV